MGIKIKCNLSGREHKFYWWEDFKNLNVSIKQRNSQNFPDNYKRIRNHEPKLHRRKVDRPSKEELSKLLWEQPTTSVAKIYNVSDNTVGKWAKWYGIIKPPRGYWQKKLTNLNNDDKIHIIQENI